MAAPGVNLADVQGLVYKGYKHLPFAGFLFAKLGEQPDQARGWLQALKIAAAARDAEMRMQPKVHLGLAASGLRRLGVPEDVIDQLPQELKEGMAARAHVLGDRPDEWTLAGALDLVLLIYADTPERLAEVMAEERARLVAAAAEVRADELAAELANEEQFGFADGLSQPFVRGIHAAPRKHEHPIALGEILLGYPNEYGKLPASPRWGDFDLGANGTFLVFRKLAQDVAGLWTHLAAQALALGLPREAGARWLGAKLMGRWPSGAPVTLAPLADDPALAAAGHDNNFGYLAHDADGLRCPISAHIRRANPRDARDGDAETSLKVVNRHRLLRRGRNFGTRLTIDAALAGQRGDDGERGLYFLGLGASIARGFEFIQQTWLANPGFHGLDGEVDPITGTGGCPFTIPADPYRIRLQHLPQIVTTLGGAYFFLPSLAALARIAAG